MVKYLSLIASSSELQRTVLSISLGATNKGKYNFLWLLNAMGNAYKDVKEKILGKPMWTEGYPYGNRHHLLDFSTPTYDLASGYHLTLGALQQKKSNKYRKK